MPGRNPIYYPSPNMSVRACIPDGTWLLKMTRYQPSHSSFVLSVLFPAYVHHIQLCRIINSNIVDVSSLIVIYNFREFISVH